MNLHIVVVLLWLFYRNWDGKHFIERLLNPILTLKYEFLFIQVGSRATAHCPAEHFTNVSTKDSLWGTRSPCRRTYKTSITCANWVKEVFILTGSERDRRVAGLDTAPEGVGGGGSAVEAERLVHPRHQVGRHQLAGKSNFCVSNFKFRLTR